MKAKISKGKMPTIGFVGEYNLSIRGVTCSGIEKLVRILVTEYKKGPAYDTDLCEILESIWDASSDCDSWNEIEREWFANLFPTSDCLDVC